MTKRRVIVSNIVALCFGIAVSFALLEAATRLLSNTLGISPYMNYDPVVGWTALPSATKFHESAADGFSATYRINADGFRGEQYDRVKPHDTKRIMVLGDSNGFGWGIDEGQQFGALLDKELDRVQVLNLALSGYGPDQSYLRFVRDGIPWQPDVVVLQLTLNDFEEIQYPFFNQKAKPQFVLDDAGNLQLLNVPVRSFGPKAEAFHKDSIPLPYREWLGWHSFAYIFLNERYYATRRQFGWNAPAPPPLPIFSPDSIRLFNAIVLELRRRLDEIGARGVIVHAAKEIHDVQAQFNGALPVVDAYSAFELAKKAGQPPLYSDGYHYTTTGNRIIATHLEAFLNEHSYLK
jgi:lysophospholipase L1-like esterase